QPISWSHSHCSSTEARILAANPGGPQVVAQISRPCHKPRSQADTSDGSKLAEPTVELSVVQTIHVAVSVEVEVPEIMGVTGTCLERGPEEVTVQLVHVATAVMVAEQPEEAVHTVASRRAVAVTVQFPSPPVVDPVPANRQGVTAVRQ